MTMEYTYNGDRLKKQPCRAVRDVKCIRGKNGNMLVRFSSGETQVVIGRQLRKIKPK